MPAAAMAGGFALTIGACGGSNDETTATSGEGSADQAPITIELTDLQLFHPYSTKRYMKGLAEDGRVFKDTRVGAYGVGVLAVATNQTAELLEPSDFRGRLRYHLADGRVVGCDYEGEKKDGTLFHYSEDRDTNGDPTWVDESEDTEESVWRPGERIRVVARQNCGPAWLPDVGVTSISVAISVTAHVAADGPERRSEELRVTLPPEAMTLRTIELPGGRSGYLSGDVVMTAGGDKDRLGLAQYDLRADAVPAGEPLPSNIPTLSGTVDGFDYRFEDPRIRSWGEAGLPKGHRQLSTTLVISRADTATEEIVAFRGLQAELDAVETQVAGTDDTDPDWNTLQRTRRQLQSQYRSALGREQRRLQRALGCDQIKVVTNRATSRFGGDQARALKRRCGEAAAEDEVRIPLTYDLQRYEYPVFVKWCVQEADCVGDCTCSRTARSIASSAFLGAAPEPVVRSAAAAEANGAAGAGAPPAEDAQ